MYWATGPGVVVMRLIVLLFTLLMSLGQALALDTNQRSTQLDVLFAKLQGKEDNLEMFQTEQKIWTLWMESDSNADDLLLSDATRAMGTGDFKTCENLLNTLIASTPSYAEAWNKRATLYYLMGRLDESLADIVKTLELEPRHFGALSGRGMIYQKQGKLGEALKAYREGLAVNPHMAGAKVAVKELEKLAPEL